MMDELIPPRDVGMMAAQHLGKTLADNPMSKDPKGAVKHRDAGHPWQEWRHGFIDTRILLHKQNRRVLALGIGLVDLYRMAPQPTLKALIELGQHAGEQICMAVLAAMLEAEETRYDIDDPHTVLAIFSGMKLRMTGRPAACRHEPSMEIHERAHNVAGALLVLFTKPDQNGVKLDVPALANLLKSLVDMDAELRNQIAKGKFNHDDHSDLD